MNVEKIAELLDAIDSDAYAAAQEDSTGLGHPILMAMEIAARRDEWLEALGGTPDKIVWSATYTPKWRSWLFPMKEEE